MSGPWQKCGPSYCDVADAFTVLHDPESSGDLSGNGAFVGIYFAYVWTIDFNDTRCGYATVASNMKNCTVSEHYDRHLAWLPDRQSTSMIPRVAVKCY